MNIFKYDRIPPPYSTMIALGTVVLLGGFLILFSSGMWTLGIWFILGGFSSIVLKAASEVWETALLGLFLLILSHGMWPLVLFIFGSFSSILLKAAAEVSDRELRQRLKKVFDAMHSHGPHRST